MFQVLVVRETLKVGGRPVECKKQFAFAEQPADFHNGIAKISYFPPRYRR